MEENGKKVLTCCNPSCKKEFKFATPLSAGNYSVACPYCKTKNKFTVRGKTESSNSAPAMGLQPNGTYRFVCSNKTCKQIVVVQAADVKKGHNRVNCPKCKTPYEFDIAPTEEELLSCQTLDCKGRLEKPAAESGIFDVSCAECGQEYSLTLEGGKVSKVKMKTSVSEGSEVSRGMKLVAGHFLLKKEYVLTEGEHYVGRYDKDYDSNFSIKDKHASRRSVKIEVNRNGENLLYKLTVVKALNPVYHNNRALSEGDIIYLTYEDTLKLGNTLIKVQKCK